MFVAERKTELGHSERPEHGFDLAGLISRGMSDLQR